MADEQQVWIEDESGLTFTQSEVDALNAQDRQWRGLRRLDWTDEECIRVSGEMICPICEDPWWKHPSVDKEFAPTLVRACDGRLLKI